MLMQLNPWFSSHAAPAPDEVWNTKQAHQIMQRHIDCPVTICPAKRHAKDQLIREGTLVPAEVSGIEG